VHGYPTCPNCSSKCETIEVYECRPSIGGCGKTFCRQCAGGLTTVRCPTCREPVFMGSVVQMGIIRSGETADENP